eukprot:642919-Amphidinium_carterae.1
MRTCPPECDLHGNTALTSQVSSRRLLNGQHPQIKMTYKQWYLKLTALEVQQSEVQQGQAAFEL